MIIVKTNMKEMPQSCWRCDYTHDDRNGCTVCSLTGEALLPMGVEKRLDECPLEELAGACDRWDGVGDGEE